MGELSDDKGVVSQGSENQEVLEDQDIQVEVAEPKTPATSVSGEETPPAVIPEYAPNYKFKVLDQEKEFDEFIRPIVTKDTEKLVRELYEKAHGIDHIKTQKQEVQAARDALAAEHSELVTGIQEAVALRDKDLGLFFDKMRLPKAKVLEWVLSQLEKEQLPEDQKKVYNESEDMKRRLYDLEKENSDLSSRRINEAVQARSLELDRVLTQSDIQPLVQAFDARLAKPGAFRDMVTRHGQAEFDMSQGKVDLTPSEAVDQVLKIAGLSIQAPSPVATPNGSAPPKVVKDDKPIVLPNLGSGTASAAAKRPKSVDDLRRLAKEMAG